MLRWESIKKRAVEIAIGDMGGALLGHSIKLVAEDSQCSADGGQTAATKLAANKQLLVVLGPSCSSEAISGAPTPVEGWDPQHRNLTQRALAHRSKASPGFSGFVRVIYNDKWQGAADAKWAYGVAGHRTGPPFTTAAPTPPSS